jgi:hypothetical protein
MLNRLYIIGVTYIAFVEQRYVGVKLDFSLLDNLLVSLHHKV